VPVGQAETSRSRSPRQSQAPLGCRSHCSISWVQQPSTMRDTRPPLSRRRRLAPGWRTPARRITTVSSRALAWAPRALAVRQKQWRGRVQPTRSQRTTIGKRRSRALGSRASGQAGVARPRSTRTCASYYASHPAGSATLDREPASKRRLGRGRLIARGGDRHTGQRGHDRRSTP